mmetsp:Transcript_15890/g.35371  ORF Transcript_15890/g.35371 Transcript_15890/m.35371 type:complete len:547 (+) Transcript_15890:335-1975(+)
MCRCRRRFRICAAFLATVLALFALPAAFSHLTNNNTTGSSNWQTQLTNDIEKIRRNANLPSIGFALVIGNTPVLTAAVGRSNIADNISATADTPYLMASVSKTFVATALMQMIDTASTTSGMSSLSININDPVNKHLPWKLDNPLIVGRINDAGDKKVIRISHLVSHTSGIRDRWIWGNEPGKPGSLYFPGDSPITLDEMMRGYFLPGGRWYNARGNFQPNRPGKNYQYANFNADLVGYLVETVTGIQLRDYSRMKLFEPLGMTNSGWRLADFANQSLIAMPYAQQGKAEVYVCPVGERLLSGRRFVRERRRNTVIHDVPIRKGVLLPEEGILSPSCYPQPKSMSLLGRNFRAVYKIDGKKQHPRPYGQFGYPDYPCGMLRSSPADVAEYMAVMLGGGRSRHGIRILRTSSVDQSFADVFKESHPNQGVFWYSRGERFFGEPNIGHSGYDYGAATEMWLLLNSRVGVAVMINQDGDAAEAAMPKVLRLLVAAGRQVALTMGACCHPDGTCSTRTQEECNAQNGRYQGNRTDCRSTACPMTTQAASF